MNLKKKGEQGAATNYISRKKALKKLQLSLNDFRRLCILKGVYPHEPTNKKKVQNGSSENKIFYFIKDIKYLAQEPIINKFRDYKVFLRKLQHAKVKREQDKFKKLMENKPEYQLDRIVKERYPTFQSAIRDLDDALCLLFIFSRFARTKTLDTNLINECQRLTAEFMHYVIEARAVTNTFVSIKGIYYQAEVMGEKLTWIVAHDRGLPKVDKIDFRVLVTFAEFYVAMLSFVNFRLYQSIGLVYPPQIASGEQTVTVTGEDGEPDEEVLEKVYSLAKPLMKRPGVEIDLDDELDNFDGEEQEETLRKLNEKKALRVLFSGCTFWLNRETPKESLAFLIRSCGGKVAWDGAPVDIKEDSQSITHQVVDRPMKEMNMSRIYIQPQFIYDCLNARRKLNASLYAPAATLPPHLSPFHSERAGDYVPVERLEELRAQGKDTSHYITVDSVVEPKEKKVKVVKKKAEGLAVTPGQMHKVNQQRIINLQGEANKMREMMIPRKQQRIYQKLKKGLKRTRTEGAALAKKRARLDEAKATTTAK